MADGIKALTLWLSAVATILLISPLTVQAQEAKPARIGILRALPPPAANLEAFRKGMQEHGHVEGKTYVVVPGWGKRGDKPSALAEKLIAGGVDVIVTVGSRSGRAAKRATRTIPIVMASSADPVAAGLVDSLAAPGGNVTGMSAFAVAGSTKGMEVLKEMIPGLRTVGTISLGGKKSPLRAAWNAANDKAKRALGIDIVMLDKKRNTDFYQLFSEAKRAGVEAVSIRSTPRFSIQMREQLVKAALRAKLPNIHTTKALVRLGGLVSFGTSRPWLFRRAAAYVDKILKGAKPADLAVERPTKFELVINLKTAKAMGITIPRSILLRADEVIE